MTVSDIAENLYSEAILLKKYHCQNRKNCNELKHKLLKIQGDVIQLCYLLTKENNYSEKYFELAEYMNLVLNNCIILLDQKNKNDRETLQKYIWGFHNLPRAYFNLENRAHISVEDAYEYFALYMK